MELQKKDKKHLADLDHQQNMPSVVDLDGMEPTVFGPEYADEREQLTTHISQAEAHVHTLCRNNFSFFSWAHDRYSTQDTELRKSRVEDWLKTLETPEKQEVDFPVPSSGIEHQKVAYPYELSLPELERRSDDTEPLDSASFSRVNDHVETLRCRASAH